MKISVFQLGALGTNCYIVIDDQTKACAIVDPGASGEAVADWLKQEDLQPKYVLLTHGHYDHVGGVAEIARKTGCDVYLRSEERTMPQEMTAGELYCTHSYGETVTAAGITFRVLHTPGHTPGSVCLIAENVIFSGDTLFAGSRGRTDFPGGNEREITASLKKLAALPGDYQVLPGHGEDTTLERERKYNYYMKGNV